MIVYKWVYKKEGKYYSLMNYGYARLVKRYKTNQPCYEINESYDNYKKEGENLKKQIDKGCRESSRFLKSGFYFWTKNIPILKHIKRKMQELGGDINAILKCEINNEDILSYERGNSCIRAKRFKVLKEII